jgi:prepilin peptidase CpaA
VAGFVGGLGYHALYGGIVASLAAAFIGFAAGLALFQLGAIGGGDVKLVTALGAMLGFPHWVFAMELAVFTAAAIALVQAAIHGRLRQTLANVAALGRWLVSSGGRKHPAIDVANPAMLRAPFGAAAALGTIVALWRL